MFETLPVQDDSRSDDAVLLVIRFSSSIPDLPLHISRPQLTSVLTVHTLIRHELPQNIRTSRLRLIYSGHVLDTTSSIKSTLPLSRRLNSRTPSPPPADVKGKSRASAIEAAQPKLYINCALSNEDALTPADIEAEKLLAESCDAALSAHPPHGLQELSSCTDAGPSRSIPAAFHADTPQGFDRLLAAGLTPTEVAELRSQFMAIQAHTHTPDTMPTPAELRALEDRWLDGRGSGAGRGASGEEGSGVDEDGEGALLDDMLWGNTLGFFWPLGAFVWLFKEDGVWSRRRQIAVGTGILINLVFGALR